MEYLVASIPQDIELLRKVAESAFVSTNDASLDEWFSFDEMQKMIQENRGVCIKAVDESGLIVGMTYAQQENPINGREGSEKWVIVITAVIKGQGGKGVGSSLLTAIEDHAKRQGARKVFVYTNKDDLKVVSFYKKNHYEDAGWIRDYQYGENNSAIFLPKYL